MARIRAIIFDFNGVIADDETPHLLTFQQALSEHGLSLTKDDYYGPYLGMDERNCATALLMAATGSCDSAKLRSIMDRKAVLFRDYTATHKPELFPGVVEFVKSAAKTCRLAIASGGRREQILYALRDTPIERDFPVIVSAEDTTTGKPDPEIYELTLKRVNGLAPQPPLIRADQCLVIEDSRAGIRAALTAGMKVVALATTYPADLLTEAHLVLPSLEGITLKELEQRLAQCGRSASQG
jgi:HAD superfamily hydrolase (TIGR01509 family)